MGNSPSHIRIDDLEFRSLEAGTKLRLVLDAFDSHRGQVELPALAVVGERPGPVVMVVAGVHGNEYEGQEAIRRVFACLEPAELGGIYFAIPVCNVFAYEARSRSTPQHLDGLNLARVFPGDPNGTPTERLAYHLMQLTVRNLGPEDLFIDLHSASEDSNYLTMVGFRDIPSAGREASEEAARHFGGCPLWVFANQQGMFNAEVSRIGIPTIGTETTGQAGCRDEDVMTFTDGLASLLRYMGMMAGDPPERYRGPAYAGITITAQATGFLRTHVQLGDTVRQGQLLGEIIDIYGAPVEEIHAPQDAQIWMQRTMPAIRVGEPACILGVPIDEYSSPPIPQDHRRAAK